VRRGVQCAQLTQQQFDLPLLPVHQGLIQPDITPRTQPLAPVRQQPLAGLQVDPLEPSAYLQQQTPGCSAGAPACPRLAVQFRQCAIDEGRGTEEARLRGQMQIEMLVERGTLAEQPRHGTRHGSGGDGA